MRLSTDLIARVLQATGRQPGVDALQGHDIEIPPTIVPVILAPAPIQRFTGFDVAATQRESQLTRFARSQGASAGQTVSPFIGLGKGTWHIDAELDSVHDYTLAPTSNNIGSALALQDSGGSVNQFLSVHWAIANVPQHTVLSFSITLPDDVNPWFLTLFNGPTGVGQTAIASVQVLANRLL